MANALRSLATRASELMRDDSSEPQSVDRGDMPICSKCGKNPRADLDGTNPWCKECRAAYHREYEAGRLARKEAKGFALGVQTMRVHLAEQFRQRVSFGSCTGIEAADWILQDAGPKMPDE